MTTSVIKHIFVIALENHDASQIYGNNADAPYINGTLVPNYARATNFDDELAQSIPSEPHYVWMEAGTNTFQDHTFTTDADPSQSNSTSSTTHLTMQIKNARNGVTWRTYQEGMNASTGACPIHRAGFYAPKHDPFVFFRDVAGSPPSATSPDCSAHHRPYDSLVGDLRARDVASYTFITPDLCNDMHGRFGVPQLQYDSGRRHLAEYRTAATDRLREPERGGHLPHVGRGTQHGHAALLGNRSRCQARIRGRCDVQSQLARQVRRADSESSHPLDCAGRQRPV
jgi:hypothetical protein